MYLLGATLTKFLATLTAVMTVTAGVTNVQCRCPDGRVKLFCHGSTTSKGCCCSPGDCARPETKSCCCQTQKPGPQKPKSAKTHSCCAHADSKPESESGSEEPRLANKAPCCEKTVVAASASYIAQNTAVPVQQSGDVLVLWQPTFVVLPAVSGATIARAPPGLLTAPPSINVLLCRFTC
jgi:hypothetical protein